MIRVAILADWNNIEKKSFFVICLTLLFHRSMIFGIMK